MNVVLLLCPIYFLHRHMELHHRPGRFPGNAGNRGNDGKFHKSHQILKQTKRCINKSCLGKISRYKTVRIKFSVESGFSNKLYDKRRKHGNAGN